MQKHEQRSCPRCGRAFECKPGNITQCQCYGIDINPRLKAFMEQRFNDCLCMDCLRHLQQDPNLFSEKYFGPQE